MKQLLVVLCFAGLTGLAWIAPKPTPPPPNERPTMIVVPTRPSKLLCKCRYYFPMWLQEAIP